MVSRPSNAVLALCELLAVIAVAAWPVPASGAEKVALLIVVISSSFSEPAHRCTRRRPPRLEPPGSEANRVWPSVTAWVVAARLVRAAAVQDEGLAVRAGDGLGGRHAAGEGGVVEAFEGQRHDDDRVGQRRQRRAGAGCRQGRRGGRGQSDMRCVAAEDRDFFLLHHLLEQAEGHAWRSRPRSPRRRPFASKVSESSSPIVT